MHDLEIPDELWERIEPLLPVIQRRHRWPGRERRSDRAHDHPPQRRALKARGIWRAIARRGVPHGSGLGVYRWVVERSLAWLHQFKRLAVRWDNRTDIHYGFLKLACCLICWRHLERSS